jgi:hypothetical protein
MGYILSLLRAWILSNLGGRIGVIIGVIIGVLGVIGLLVFEFIGDGATGNGIIAAIVWAFLSLIAIPLFGIVGAIIGAIVKKVTGR